METYSIRNLSFKYSGHSEPALEGINLELARGSFTVLCGRSGSGKTTLLRLLKSAVSPAGELRGELLFCGEPLFGIDACEQSAEIGFVGQNPENQIVCDKVWHELAFGLESLGYPTAQIRARVAETAAFFGIEPWFRKDVALLSGGQKQMLNLAAVMVMRPSVLLLDEPTAMLDPIAAAEFSETLRRINTELGVTIVLAEHNTDTAISMADKIAILDGGRIAAYGTAFEVGQIISSERPDLLGLMPVPMRLYFETGFETAGGQACPVTVRDGRNWLSELVGERETGTVEIRKNACGNRVMAEMKDVWFRYQKNAPDVLRGVNLKVRCGEIYALMGGNGAGKTTAVSVLGGLLKPIHGTVFADGRRLSEIPRGERFRGLIGVLPQNPQMLFVGKTVREDLYDMLSELKIPQDEREEELRRVAGLCGLTSLLNRHPYDLSGGEQQRAALAKVLLTKPKILILDEPTKGMDNLFKRKFGELLHVIAGSGKCVIMVSHDTEFCAEYADRVGLFFDGGIVSEALPQKFFTQNSYYTTVSAKIARGFIQNAVICEDIISAVSDGRNKPHSDGGAETESIGNAEEDGGDKSEPVKKVTRRNYKGHLWLVLLLAAVIVPLTVFAGVYFLNDRKFYFISFAVILEALAVFAAAFEGRKPREREIVVLAVFCALAVAGRSAFFMLPQFKPTAAIVIVAGLCFGGEAGFLVGAASMLISGMFMGQGSWTPWQMLAMGAVGAAAGFLFHSGALPRRRVPICIFGALAVFVIYGGIINPASVLMVTPYPEPGAILLSYIRGAWFDLIHSGATALFLWLIAEPLTEKFERVKLKYELF